MTYGLCDVQHEPTLHSVTPSQANDVACSSQITDAATVTAQARHLFLGLLTELKPNEWGADLES